VESNSAWKVSSTEHPGDAVKESMSLGSISTSDRWLASNSQWAAPKIGNVGLTLIDVRVPASPRRVVLAASALSAQIASHNKHHSPLYWHPQDLCLSCSVKLHEHGFQ